MFYINFIAIAMLVLVSHVGLAAGSLTIIKRLSVNQANLASLVNRIGEDRVEMLRSLLMQPLDKQRLQRMLELSISHDRLTSTFILPPSYRAAEALRKEPDYVPDLYKAMEAISFLLYFVESRVEKLSLWKIIDMQGKQHWLFGTNLFLDFDNFEVEARQQLESVIDTSTVIMHEIFTELYSSTKFREEMQTKPDNKGSEHETYYPYPWLIDEAIIARGRQGDKKIVALETSDDILAHWLPAIGYFVSLVPDLVSQKIKTALLSPKQLAANKVKMIDEILQWATAYLTADINTMQHDSKTLKLFHKGLAINARNNFWIDRIVTQCQQNESCLVVANIGHMTNDNWKNKSLITLLRERGFTVELVQ